MAEETPTSVVDGKDTTTTLESSGQETQNTQAASGQEQQSEETQPKDITLPSDKFKERLEKAKEQGRKEAEAQAAEAKRQAELSAEEKAKEREQAAADKEKALEAKELRLERKSELLGKVSNPERVLALIALEENADAFFDGNKPNMEAILKAFPEYAPKASGVELPNLRNGEKVGSFTAEDVRRMTPDEINKNWEKIKHIKI